MSVYLDDFDDVYAFYGVSCCAFKLNDTVYEAVEDPSDGYRSALNRVNIVDEETIGLLARYGPSLGVPSHLSVSSKQHTKTCGCSSMPSMGTFG